MIQDSEEALTNGIENQEYENTTIENVTVVIDDYGVETAVDIVKQWQDVSKHYLLAPFHYQSQEVIIIVIRE